MVLLDICFVPCVFGLAWCCLGGTGAAIKGASSTCCCSCNEICPCEDDDERPRKMTKEEIERYNKSK